MKANARTIANRIIILGFIFILWLGNISPATVVADNGVKLSASVFYAPESYVSNPADHLIDGNKDTFYESNWDTNGGFFKGGEYLILDLQENKEDIGRIIYTPRQDKANGRIAQYNIYLSSEDLSGQVVDGSQEFLDKNFKLAGRGSWDTLNKDEQTITFKSDEARYVAIQALSTGGDGNTLSVAEIEVIQKQVSTIDTTDIERAIEKIERLKYSGVHNEIVDNIDSHLDEIGDVNTLTKESMTNYTKLLNKLYELYAGLGENNSIKNGEVWLDTNGVPIQAHGGGIIYNEEDKTYY